MIYFAYGSNMLASRLQRRIESRDLGRAVLSGWRIICNKPSKDGSGKVNITLDPGAEVLGVLYRVDAAGIEDLDAIEYGYERTALMVDGEGGRVLAQVYIWTAASEPLALYRWYLDLVIAGALEHGLPEAYIEQFRRAPIMPEPDGSMLAVDRRKTRGG
ncbi:MAG: gamma-glutamylcyclotransferase [Deltaproteobacteria bacterium]|nr:gamma-glutamylcyclotransferase [Deltaproteobacteria bacterium]